jgi:exopolysaccharide biosynthesis polyprenyl glycosylphosphotransferase
MYHGRKQQFDWTFSLKIGDVIAVLLSFPAAFLIWPLIAPGLAVPAENRVTVVNYILYGCLILYFLSKYHLYAWRPFIRYAALARQLPLALLSSLGAFLLIRFMVGVPSDPAYLPFMLVHLGIAFALISLERVLVRMIDISIGGVSCEHIAIVGWSHRLDRVLKAMQQGMGRFQITEGFFSCEGSNDAAALKRGYQLLGSLDQLGRILEERKITILLVDEAKVSLADMKLISDRCSDQRVSMKSIPSTFEIWANRISIRVVAGVPLMGINDLHHDRFGNRALKRMVDIACATFGLIVSAPIIAILAILIKRESPGPVFYRQVRLGFDEKPFEIIKLRSMRLDAEKQTGAVWAVQDDDRRLKIGAFMRKLNLDELPQFWNVLKGEMSMVGPRPERPQFVQDFRETVPFYNLRHTCKPGLTGWAAINGLRGDTSLEDRLEYDLYYIANWSLWLDFRIMLMTLAPPKNAY